MSNPRVNFSPQLTETVVRRGLLDAEAFFLVDVGASGGVDKCWEMFGKYRAVGFDPLIKECERLNAEAAEGVEYRPYFIGSDDETIGKASEAPSLENPFMRSSATRASEETKVDFIKEHFNAGEEVVYTEDRASLDTLFLQADHTVDFVKIDTDGHDYEVLHGARQMLAEKQVLGLFVECQFHGPKHEHANVFRNIDRLMAEAGFSLFDIDICRYTRGELPGEFVHPFPAQTRSGQVTWGDALYLLDYAADGFAELYARILPPLKILKLACLYEIYELPDCAAELLLRYRDELSSLIDVDEGLDLLAKNLDTATSYREYSERFTTDIADFYPPTAEDEDELEYRLREAKTRVSKLHYRVSDLEKENTRLQKSVTDLLAEIEALRTSKSWQLTKPLRAVSRFLD